jgi:hypothetical protein
VVEVQIRYDFQEPRNRLQVSLFRRNVRATQRLGQSRDLEAGVVLRRIKPPLRQSRTDRATKPGGLVFVWFAICLMPYPDTSRSKYVSRRLIKASWRLLPQARLRARSEIGFGSSDISFRFLFG